MLGAGKTVLAPIVVDFLLTTFPQDFVSIAWFLCSFEEKQIQYASNILGSMIQQLIEASYDGLKDMKSAFIGHMFRNVTPSVDELAPCAIAT